MNLTNTIYLPPSAIYMQLDKVSTTQGSTVMHMDFVVATNIVYVTQTNEVTEVHMVQIDAAKAQTCGIMIGILIAVIVLLWRK